MKEATTRPRPAFRLAIAAAAGRWLAATPRLEATILLHESFGFNTNTVQTSPDLVNWTTLLTTNVPLSAQIPIDDPTATNLTRRFYRSFETR